MTGIGPEFLRLLEGIEWGDLTARDAVQLRAALQKALTNSNQWFGELSKDFGQQPAGAPIYNDTGRPPEPAPTSLGAAPPPVKALPEGGRKRAAGMTRRRRGRPTPQIRLKKAVDLKVNRPEPLAIGGADAETGAGPQAAKLFENSYVSKDGPRTDMPAALPANHPRRGLLNRESSVTPEVDVADFAEVEQQVRAGKPVNNIFQ